MAEGFLPPDEAMTREKLVAPEWVKKEGERAKHETDEINRQREASANERREADAEKEKQMEALRAAKPSWTTDGHGIRGFQNERRRTTNDVIGTLVKIGSIERRIPGQDFDYPPDQSQTTTAGELNPNISFLLKDATTHTGHPPVESNKVRVFSGRINGEFPSGMPSDNYILDLEFPENSIIYALVSYNPSTSMITARDLAVWKPADGAFPESRAEDSTHGFLIYPLGFTYFDVHGKFQVWNQRLGDIKFEFEFGAFNAQPAEIPVDSIPGWIDLSFM